MKISTMAKEVNAASMAGDNPLEKEINALITKAFIGSHDLPDDECLNEARAVIKIRQESLRNKVVAYLTYQFGGPADDSVFYQNTIKRAEQAAQEIDDVLVEKRFFGPNHIVRIS